MATNHKKSLLVVVGGLFFMALFSPSLFTIDAVSAQNILDDLRDDCRKIEQKLPAGWTIEEGAHGPCSLIVPADPEIEIIDDVEISVPGVEINKYSSESQAQQGFQEEVERERHDSSGWLSPQEGSSSLLDTQAELTILRNEPNFDSPNTGANIAIQQIFGRCVLTVGGSSGGSSELLSFLKYIHDEEDAAAAESGKRTFLGDHRGFDHAQLDRLIRDTNDTLQQAAMAAVDVCGQDIPAQPAETPVPALVADAPSEADLPIDTGNENLTIRIIELEGIADMQLPDGTWKPANMGDEFPVHSLISVGYDSIVTIQFSNKAVIVLPPLTEIRLIDFIDDPEAWIGRLKFNTGEIRFKVLEGDFRTDMKVSTPVNTGTVVGTDFGAAYDPESSMSVWEIYDGSLEVSSHITDEKRTITSLYGSPIKRLTVTADGRMTEQTAIPGNEWDRIYGKNSGAWPWIAILIAAGGAGYLAYRSKDKIIAVLKKPKTYI